MDHDPILDELFRHLDALDHAARRECAIDELAEGFMDDLSLYPQGLEQVLTDWEADHPGALARYLTQVVRAWLRRTEDRAEFHQASRCFAERLTERLTITATRLAIAAHDRQGLDP